MSRSGDFSMFNPVDAAAMRAGYRAACNGETTDANPFVAGDNEHDAWLMGFNDLPNGGIRRRENHTH